MQINEKITKKITRDEIKIENLKLRVVELKDRRIKKILVERVDDNFTI